MPGSGSALVRPVRRPEAERRLVCFSFCGGGTAPFRPWGKTLPESVELVLCCYPGREGRYSEPFARTWDELIADAVAAVRQVTDRPYVLFGHSMGSWVAFDVAARIAAAGIPAPEALVVSASTAPTRWSAKHQRPPTPHDSDEDLLAWMHTVGQLSAAILADRDLSEMAIEVMRADLTVSASYRYPARLRVDIPMHVLYGTTDDEVDGAAAACWAELTTAGCRTDQLPGGHFYTPEVWATLPSFLRVPGFEATGAPR